MPLTAIPTLNQWGLIALAGILGIIGFMVIRRRKVAA
ncbi:MAG: IPTL-CTERM sorting domain-containing protein [Candidatus Dadabacteria bacterium]|nr:IPTL-CTERM sorting domain-containing protein [Candidatus Dadabacteria bacterium]TDI88924.1 MAG: IPTL-CTERM sorting domain-containing protein [Candidatus Dadabacteria bacterium]TDJ03161.1 MAG: IPTL-CTERM sorting domain-containing protein [Candidatus Dadabacteria bacterium]